MMRILIIIIFISLMVILSCCNQPPTREIIITSTPSSEPPQSPIGLSDTPVSQLIPDSTQMSEPIHSIDEPTLTDIPTFDANKNNLIPTVDLDGTETFKELTPGDEVETRWILMFSDNKGWSLATPRGGGDEYLLFTQDGGMSWLDRSPPQPVRDDYQSALADFLELDHGWVVYTPSDPLIQSEQVYIWRTNDGGMTWNPSEALDRSGLAESFYPSHLQFVDPLNGWLLVHVGVGMNHDYVALYQSQDGGLSWRRIQDPFLEDSSIQACLKTGMQFTDPDHGWLTGDCSGVADGALLFKSDDGGESWEFVQLPEPVPGLFSEPGSACGTYSPVFLEPQKGHLVVRCIISEGETITT